MNKRFCILLLISVFSLAFLSIEACSSTPVTVSFTKTVIVQGSLTPVSTSFLTEDEAISNALTYLPPNIVMDKTIITAALDSQASVDGEWHIIFGFYNQTVTVSMLGWTEYASGNVYEAEIVIDARGGYSRRSLTFGPLGGPMPSGTYSTIASN
jgi:hypothetical protein